MNRNNFITLAASMGYAPKSFVRRWLIQTGRQDAELHEDDLEEVYRAFERAAYLKDEGTFHERHPLPTTKKYGEVQQ